MRICIATPSLEQAPLLGAVIQHIHGLATALGATGKGQLLHVVADGASQDESVAVLESHRQGLAALGQGNSFRYDSQPDSGMYQALNRAFACGEGEILGYLCCDDRYTPWALDKVLSHFDRHPTTDLLVGDAIEIRGGRAALVIQPPAAMLWHYLGAGYFLPQPAVFFRRRLWQRLGGFDESLGLLGDQDFFLRALASGARVRRLWEVLAAQNMHPDQLMARRAEQAADEKHRILAGYHYGGPLWRQLLERQGLKSVSPLMHRLGVLAKHLLPTLPKTLPMGHLVPWSEFRKADIVKRLPAPDVLWTMAQSTRGKGVYDLSAKGMALLSHAGGEGMNV